MIFGSLEKNKKTRIEESSIFGSLKNIKEMAKNRRFLEFLISFEKTVATLKKNWLFENSENWRVSGHVPDMITDGYLSLIQTPAQHWF